MNKYINAEELKRRLTGNFREIHIDQLKALIDEMPGVALYPYPTNGHELGPVYHTRGIYVEVDKNGQVIKKRQ